MLKTILSFFVLFFFLVYVLSSPIIWATYYVYQDYIAHTFCVNKQNPDCCGKCYVNEIEDDKPKNEPPKIEVRTPELSSFVVNNICLHMIDNHTLILFASFGEGDISNGFTVDLTHPPE